MRLRYRAVRAPRRNQRPASQRLFVWVLYLLMITEIIVQSI